MRGRKEVHQPFRENHENTEITGILELNSGNFECSLRSHRSDYKSRVMSLRPNSETDWGQMTKDAFVFRAYAATSCYNLLNGCVCFKNWRY